MIDIHSHFIPSVDDGAKSIEDTFDMLQEAANVGFTDVIATPHYIIDYYDKESDEIKYWVEKLQEAIEKCNINLVLHSGMEIYVSEQLDSLLSNRTVLKLANSNYILVELPQSTTVKFLDEIVFLLVSMGLRPIIAHPERYKAVQDNPKLIEEYIEKGCFIQCNYGSILNVYGKKARKTLKVLLKKKFVHFFGSDTHNSKGIYLLVPKAIKKLKKIVGDEVLYKLTTENPKKILDNEECKTI